MVSLIGTHRVSICYNSASRKQQRFLLRWIIDSTHTGFTLAGSFHLHSSPSRITSAENSDDLPLWRRFLQVEHAEDGGDMLRFEFIFSLDLAGEGMGLARDCQGDVIVDVLLQVSFGVRLSEQKHLLDLLWSWESHFG